MYTFFYKKYDIPDIDRILPKGQIHISPWPDTNPENKNMDTNISSNVLCFQEVLIHFM